MNKNLEKLKLHCSFSDLTINSIACDIDGNIIDTCGGIEDLKEGIIRFVGNPQDRIKEDPLRILRAIRFISKYNFSPNYETEQALVSNIAFMDLPLERVQEELMKILQYDNGIKDLVWFNLLGYIFPEYNKVVGMWGGQFHNESVNIHMKNVFKESCKLTDNVLLRLACFLHDIGKSVTQTFDDGNIKKIHFYEHHQKGCELMEKRLKLLKFSNEDIKYVTTLIRLHMYSFNIPTSKKSLIKFFNQLKEANIPIEDYLILNYCDMQGNMAKPRIKFGDFLKSNWLYKKYQEITYSEEPMTVKDLKVKGQDVMDIFNVKGGIFIGQTLNRLYNLVMDGELSNNRAELMNKLKVMKKMETKYRQYIIIPKSLNMSKGKAISQSCHASFMALENQREISEKTKLKVDKRCIEYWKNTGMCVIVLECEDTIQLMGIAKYLEQWKIPNYLYIDEGATEVKMGTPTALATGVLPEECFWMFSQLKLFKERKWYQWKR